MTTAGNRPGRWRLWVARFAALGIAGAVGLWLTESVARLFLKPVDFLQPRLVKDERLGHRIAPGSAGHDAWGFRNLAVPPHADVVAVGDSQTYGVAAPRPLAWPAQLARISGLSVYNMGLGAYGPRQYEILVREYAPRLQPRIVVVGVYMGNDLYDAAAGTAEDGPGGVPAATVADRRLLRGLRDFLSENSVVYRATTLLGGDLLRRCEGPRGLAGAAGPEILRRADGKAITGLTPTLRLLALDHQSAQTSRGLQALAEAIRNASDSCGDHGIRFLVAVIPTKESAYRMLIERDGLQVSDAVRRVWAEETEVREAFASGLATRAIAWVDVLPALQRATLEKTTYPSNDDGHPNGAGYAAIATAIAGHHLFGELETSIHQ